MYVATFAKSFKEAQSYLSFLMMAQMVPGHDGDDEHHSPPRRGCITCRGSASRSLLTDVLGNKPINPLVFLVVGAVNITLAVVVIRATAGLLHREKIIFGR